MIAHVLAFLIVVLVGYVKIGGKKNNLLKIDIEYPKNGQISEFSSDYTFIWLDISKDFKISLYKLHSTFRTIK